jgi:hypothetical protein
MEFKYIIENVIQVLIKIQLKIVGNKWVNNKNGNIIIIMCKILINCKLLELSLM